MVIFYYFINNKKALKKENYLRDFLRRFFVFLRDFLRDFLRFFLCDFLFLRRPPAKGEAHPQPPPLFFVFLFLFLRRPPIGFTSATADSAAGSAAAGSAAGSAAAGSAAGSAAAGSAAGSATGAVVELKGFGIEGTEIPKKSLGFLSPVKGQNPPLILCLRFVRLFFVLFLRIYKLLILFYDSVFI
jgi:hypothetical protein